MMKEQQPQNKTKDLKEKKLQKKLQKKPGETVKNEAPQDNPIQNPTQKETLSGFICLFGPANAGKSTLLNKLVGKKVSIVSPLPNTTRKRICGIKNLLDISLQGEKKDAQLIYVDTPGFQIFPEDKKDFLRTHLRKVFLGAVIDVDLKVLVLEPSFYRRPSEIEAVFKACKKHNIIPNIILLNKIDLLHEKQELLPAIESTDRLALSIFETNIEILPLSAMTNQNVEELEKFILKHLRPGPTYFPLEESSDLSETDLVAEIIREQFFYKLQDEIPYSTAVLVRVFEEELTKTNEDILRVEADIILERQSQKPIVVGKDGEMIKKIGTKARQELEKLFDIKVFLKLNVRIEKNWRASQKGLDNLGFRM